MKPSAHETPHAAPSGAQSDGAPGAVTPDIERARPYARPPAWEVIAVGVLCVASIASNISTTTWYPTPWCDEVLSVDMAVNCYQGRGFTSAAWPSQPSTQLWASFPPAYPVLLYWWLCVFGFSAESVRSLNFVLMPVGALLVWWACVRLSLVRRPGARLGMVALLLLAASMTYLARRVRSDAVTYVLAAATLLAWSIPRPRLRLMAIFGLAALYPMAGLQLVAYAALMCLLLLLFLGRTMLKVSVVAAAGCLTGLLLLICYYTLRGVGYTFVATTILSPHGIAGELGRAARGDPDVFGRLRHRLGTLLASWRGYVIDPSFIPVLIVVALGNVWPFRPVTPAGRRVAAFGLLAALVVPPFILNVGKYNFYYTWMAFVPAVIAACRVLEELSDPPRLALARYGLSVALIYAALIGLPYDLYKASAPAQRAEFARIERFVDENVRSDDWVYGDAPVYYGVKERGAMFFYYYSYATHKTHLPEIPEDERRAMTVLIVPVDRFDWAAQRVGGKWVDTGQRLVLGDVKYKDLWEPMNTQLIAARDMDAWKPTLGVYRREGSGPSP
jgi:hypothetical protein